jgi:hypothetical protein
MLPLAPNGGLDGDGRQSQLSVVSVPRNQRYLQPPPHSAGVVACQRQNSGKGAGEFDHQLAIDW